MLVKLNQNAHFTNILQAAFLYETTFCNFYVLIIWDCNFWQKEFGEKLLKNLGFIEPGVDVTKILWTAFGTKVFFLQLFSNYS
jgi:hypothetical protein